MHPEQTASYQCLVNTGSDFHTCYKSGRFMFSVSETIYLSNTFSRWLMGCLDTNSVYIKVRNNILPTWPYGWKDTRKVTWKGTASLCLHFVCILHRLGGPQSRCECYRQHKVLLSSPGFEPLTFQPRASSLQGLRYSGSHHVLYVAHESNSSHSPLGEKCVCIIRKH